MILRELGPGTEMPDFGYEMSDLRSERTDIEFERFKLGSQA